LWSRSVDRRHAANVQSAAFNDDEGSDYPVIELQKISSGVYRR